MHASQDPVSKPRLTDLFIAGRAPATLLLGGGVGLEAVEFYVTSSLMPSMVRDIGGLELLAWTTTLFIAAIVLGSIFVVIRPRNLTLNRTYITGCLIFSIGCAVIGLAPNMVTVLIGRAIQGFGAGLMVTMAYSFIRFVYPPGLQNAASALYTTLWGVAVFLGPSLGGLFASGSQWRWAFLILIPVALLMAAAAPRMLPPGEDDRNPERPPILQIGLILSAILAVSFAGTNEDDRLRGLLVAAGILLGTAFLVTERMSTTRLLPRQSTWLGHMLSRVYLVMFLMIVGLNSDIYIPYFLQTLHATSPLVAGYVVALVALGWTAAGLGTASLTGRGALVSILVGAVLSFGSILSLAFVVARSDPSGSLSVLTLTSILLFGMGAGVGFCWAHLVSLILTRADEPEADKASASINLIQSLAAAFGAAAAGVIANGYGLAEPGGIEGALNASYHLYALMALPAAAAFLVALTLFRKT